ncbi:MAG: ABC transporter ATP-binding protein [Desulfobacterales bacterium GWB2_56_26]|nr:MAG: ABC transporter ATP-binding protein [Desulfobacterales bacterium GWB2_56_26]
MKRDNPSASSVTAKPLLHWAFSGNLKLQLMLLLVIVLIVAARVVPLEMQKRIINDAIALQNLRGLFLYCAIYILAITVASGLKLSINYLQTVIGERAMTAMRKSLYNHILTLPLNFFRTTQPGTVVSSLMTELSTAGSFAGMAFAVPVSNILTLLAFTGYLVWLNTKLALATLIIYPIVVLVIPVLQKKTNKANKKRVDLARATSSQIAESITGIHEVQAHGAYSQEGGKFARLAERLQKIRIRWSLFRFGIKTANNYFVGLGPFVVFVYGGYLIMHGQLELGAMVAFLSAQEKLYDPWKELIEFYQIYQDASISYRRTMSSFDAEPEFSPDVVDTPAPRLTGRLEVQDLVYDTPEGLRLLNGISFSLAAGEHLAVVGFSGGGKSTLFQCLGKMFNYSSGSIRLDGMELSTLSKRTAIEGIGYISQNPFIFTGTIEDNLLYAQKALGRPKPAGSGEETKADLDRMILVLQQVGLFVDVMRFGLDSQIATDDQPVIDKIIRIRLRFHENFGERLADYVEFYRRDTYHVNSSVAENILFGTSNRPDFDYHLLPDNSSFRSFLQSVGLLEPLLALSVELARQAVDLLTGVDKVDIFFKNSPVPADRLEHCERILNRLKKQPLSSLPSGQQSFLLSLALNFTPAIHTMTRLPAGLEKKILAARLAFPKWAESIAADLFTFYSDTSYIHGQSILNNIFFGRIRPALPHAQEVMNQAIMHLLVEEDFLEKVAAIGMASQVGNMGDRLSGGQRQKLAIARVLMKSPKIILMDEATSALDNKSQARIQRLMTTRWRGSRTVIAAVHRLDIIEGFDKVAVMKAGKLVEFGTYHELLERKGSLHELIYGRKK